MRLAVIGSGYVGLVSGACFAEFGTDVIVVESEPAKLAALRDGKMPIYEPGLEKAILPQVADIAGFDPMLAQVRPRPARREERHAPLGQRATERDDPGSVVDREQRGARHRGPDRLS